MLTDSLDDRGLCLSPCSHGVWSRTRVLGWESERPQHTGTPAKPNHISSGHWHPFLGTHWPPEEYPNIPLYTHQPWLVSLGEGHFIHKNASFKFLKIKKKKRKKSCSTMVICIQRKKNPKTLVCTAQSPKQLEALTHICPHHTSFSVFTLALC